MKILQSATKIVLLLTTIALVVGFLFVIFTKQADGKEVLEMFKSASLLILGFFFAYKGDSNKPFAGK